MFVKMSADIIQCYSDALSYFYEHGNVQDQVKITALFKLRAGTSIYLFINCILLLYIYFARTNKIISKT